MYSAYPPPPHLSAFIKCFWICDADTDTAPALERTLPTGTPELVITLGHNGFYAAEPRPFNRNIRVPAVRLRGAHTQWYSSNEHHTAFRLGVHFKPGGATPFLPLPADELTNTQVDLRTLWGRHASELYERLLEAQNSTARIRLLVDALMTRAMSTQSILAKAGRPLARHPAVANALRIFHTTPQAWTIAEVVEQSGFSHRYFNALFRAEVGLSPKQFCHVRRFRDVLSCTQKGQPVAWADIALAHGYYDQAHLINDFRHFAGLSPTAYLRDRHVCFDTFVRHTSDAA